MGFVYSNPNPKDNYMAQSAVDEDERRVLMDCANKLK